MAQTQRKSSGNKNFGALVAVLVIAGVAVLGYLALKPKAGPVEVDPATLTPGQAQGYTVGRPDAPVKVVEFADFECPGCAQFAVLTEPDVRKRLIDTGIIQFTFYDFPLPMHKNTWVASNAAACADEQGRFWDMHDRLFMGQNEWNGQVTGNPKKVIKPYAAELGLDVAKFEACLDEDRHYARIAGNKAEAERRMIQYTPTIFIGNKKFEGGISFDDFNKAVEEVRAAAAASAPAPAKP